MKNIAIPAGRALPGWVTASIGVGQLHGKSVWHIAPVTGFPRPLCGASGDFHVKDGPSGEFDAVLCGRCAQLARAMAFPPDVNPAPMSREAEAAEAALRG